METKSISLELKDLDKSKRTAVIAHAAYNNIDRTKDISRKGMFAKSWQESKQDVNLYLNHDDTQAPGKILDLFEDDNFAYTKAWFGTHTLGNDVLIMMDEGVIKKASFGYIVEDKAYIEHRNERVRELKQVKHIETSVLTKVPANPLASVQQVNKSFEELSELKQHLALMEKFCRDTKATDECIKTILLQIEEAKAIISRYDADTRLISEPEASSLSDDSFKRKLLFLNTKI